jgi:Zn-finger nucleic acid-binding protein
MRQSGTDGIYVSPVCYNTHMNNIDATWYKWDYVCPNCDANIEMTIKSNGQNGHISLCPYCRNSMILMSVLDVTIVPSTKEKEVPNMENEMTITTSSGDRITFDQGKLQSFYDKYALMEKHNYLHTNMVAGLSEIIVEAYQDSEDKETLQSIVDLFDIVLTKEVAYTATIYVSGLVTVNLTDETDVQYLVVEELSVSSCGSVVSVEDFHVEDVEENY